jgi:thioredoxin-related protein
MKKFFLPTLVLLLSSLAFSAFTLKNNPTEPPKVKWITWQEAVELNKKEPRKIMVDVFTEWCGWCKVMDRETFTDEKVAEYMSKNFYCVKFDAEMKETIDFSGHKFEYVANQGRNGVHTLAYSLLDGQMGYPSLVYLTETFERISISPGYKKPEQLMPELKFAAENIYKNQSWQDYINGKK